MNQGNIGDNRHGFTDEDYIILNRLSNYTDYTNENIITVSTDGQVNIIEEEERLLKDAMEQLYIQSHPQFSFSCSLVALNAINEFQNIQDYFQIYNFIHLQVRDDYCEKLRLTQITENPFDDSSDLSVTFSNIIRSMEGIDDFVSLLGDNVTAKKNSISRGSSSSKDEISLTTEILQYIADSNTFQNKYNNILAESINTSSVNANQNFNNFFDTTFFHELEDSISERVRLKRKVCDNIYEFPSMDKVDKYCIYIDSSTGISYIWDSDVTHYVVIGSDYTTIKTITGGQA